MINECLRRKQKRWTFVELREYISEKLYEEFNIEKGIGPRQLAEDISIMRRLPPQGFDAPIKRRDGFVFYSDPDFSIKGRRKGRFYEIVIVQGEFVSFLDGTAAKGNSAKFSGDYYVDFDGPSVECGTFKGEFMPL